MQHSRNADVLHICELRRELRGQVNARHRLADGFVVLVVLGRNIGRHFQPPAVARGGNLYIEALAAEQIGVGNLVAIAHDADDAIGHRELRNRRAETR